jgi:hypothetical protein
VKIIPFDPRPSQLMRQSLPKRRFAATGHPHHHNALLALKHALSLRQHVLCLALNQ